MNCNNVLILGAPQTGKIRLAQLITGDYDTSTVPDHSHSGLVYKCLLVTKYYSLEINLLIEEFPPARNDPNLVPHKCLEDWYQEFISDDLTDLRDVIEGIVFTFSMDEYDAEQFELQMQILTNLKDSLAHDDAFFVVMGISSDNLDHSKVEDFEDLIIVHGFEFVYYNASGSNSYNDKIGKDRLKEVFESHCWSQTEEPEVTEKDYLSHKQEKMLLMTENLLPNGDISKGPLLEVLMNKLQLEKSKVACLDRKDQKAYVDALVEEFIEYF